MTSGSEAGGTIDGPELDSADGGDSRQWYSIGGTMRGLQKPVTLQLSVEQDTLSTLTVTSNGSFEFPEPVQRGIAYHVSIAKQPSVGYCNVTHGAGTALKPVETIAVECYPDNPGISDVRASVGQLSPAFSPDKTRYRLDVFAWISHVELSPVLVDNDAQLTLNGTEFHGRAIGVELDPGQTSVVLDIELGNGQRKTYVVDIYRATRVVESAYGKAQLPIEGAQLGYSLALNRTVKAGSSALLAVGAPAHSSRATTINGVQTDLGAALSGAVLLYRYDNEQWQETAFIKPHNSEAEDLFGYSVALDGDRLVVGASEEDGGSAGVNGPNNNDLPSSGAVYVFRFHDDRWEQEAYLKADYPHVSDGFGRSVALQGERLVIGAWHDSNSAVGTNPTTHDTQATNSGAAYVFEYRNGGWEQTAYLKPSNTDFADSFGESVALDGDTLVVGAPLESGAVARINGDQSNNDAFAAGAAYVFEYDADNDSWFQSAYLKASNARSQQRFGNSVSIDANTIAVGAYTEDTAATGINPELGEQAPPTDATPPAAAESGAAYVFVRNDNTWSQQAFIKSSNSDPRDRFGHQVIVRQDTLIAGAPLESSADALVNADPGSNDAVGAGAAYVFFRTGDVWRQAAVLKASNPEAGDNFGTAVTYDGAHLVVGAPYEDGALGGTTNASGPNNASIAAGAFYSFR